MTASGFAWMRSILANNASPTEKVLASVLEDLTLGEKDFALLKPLKALLATSARRSELSNWLKMLLKASPASSPETIAPYIHSLAIAVLKRGKSSFARTIDKRRLLLWLIAKLSGSQSWNVAELRLLFAAGLGIEFVRYSPGQNEYYNHCLISGLLPTSIVQRIQQAVTFPYGTGTVGRVVQETKLSGKVRVHVLKSSFLDLKGTVASEDLLMGARSWAGVPIFDETSEIGVVFIFFPVEDLFVEPATRRRQSTRLPSSSNRPTALASKFGRLIGAKKNELLLALQNEDMQRLLSVATPAADTQDAGEEAIATLQQFATLAMDPLGVQVGLKLSMSRIPPEELTCEAFVRERSFFNRWEWLLHTSSLYPSRWSPQKTVVLDRLRCTPTLCGQSQWITREGRAEPARLIVGSGDDQSLMAYHSSAAGLNDDQLRKQMAGASAFQHQMQLGWGAFVKAPQMASLVAPLVTKATADAGPYCTGFLDITYVLAEDSSMVGLSSEDSEQMQTLKQWIDERFTSAAGPSISQMLSKCEEQIANQPIEAKKVFIDLRGGLCKAICDRLAQAMTEDSREHGIGSPFRQSIETYSHLSGISNDGVTAVLKAATECERVLETFARQLHEFHKTVSRVISVSFAIWLTFLRPCITAHRGNMVKEFDRDLILADASAGRLLELLAQSANDVPHRVTYKRPSKSFSLQWVPSKTSRIKPAIESLPPIFCLQDDQLGCVDRVDVLAGGSQISLTKNGRRLDLDWEYTQFPELEALAPIPGRTERCLLGDFADLRHFKLSGVATSLGTHKLAQMPLTQILEKKTSTPSSPVGILPQPPMDFQLECLGRLIEFLGCASGNEQQSTLSYSNEWLVAGLNEDGQRGVLLLYGRSSDFTFTARMRSLVLRRIQQRFIEQVRAEAVRTAEAARNHLSFVRHLTDPVIRDITAKLKLEPLDLPSALKQREFLANKFQELKCQLAILAGDIGDGSTLKHYRDFTVLLRTVWQWNGHPDKALMSDVPSHQFSVANVYVLYMVFANLVKNLDDRNDPRCELTFSGDSYFVDISNDGLMPDEWAAYLTERGPLPPAPGEDTPSRRGLRTVVWAIRKSGLPKLRVTFDKGRTIITSEIPRRDFDASNIHCDFQDHFGR